MAAFDFPNSPNTNDVYTANGVSFKWNGTVWQRISASTGAQGATGPTGAQGAQGHQGATGSGGSTGAQGATGPTGAQGAGGGGGAQGAVGAQGATGSAGSTGIPSGVILLWSGNTGNIPPGWVLCNGSNGTPDLRDRFIVGGGNSYSVGAQGGSSSVTLTTSNLPSHTHGDGSLATGNPNTSLTGTATYIAETWAGSGQASGIFGKNGGYGAYFTPGSPDTSPTGQLTIDATHSHDVTGSTGPTGSGGSHENRPPYYALCYIMKS